MLAGIIVAGAIPAITSTYGYDEQKSMALIGWIMIGFGLVLFSILLIRVDEPNIPIIHSKERAVFAIRDVFKNQSFRLL